MRNTTFLDCDDTLYECFSPDTADPWETDFAALVPRFTGSISAISSGLIIYVILRSKTRLSSIYHRIMFGMCLADICGSIAMALTSLPMPSYMPKEEIYGYSWAGTRLGNTYTCSAQGFFVFFGVTCIFNYNAMLCVYYACAIALTMKEKTIKKYVEPIIHGLPIIISLGFAVTPLFFDLYNPGISGFPWCGTEPYPNECSHYGHVECIRGNVKIKRVVQSLISIVIMIDFACVLISLGLVSLKVIRTNHVLLQISKLYRDRGHPEMEKVLQKHRNSKVVIIQAFSYIAAFVLGMMPPALLSVGAIHSGGQDKDEAADVFEKMMLVLLPLQGFFNFVIFVAHKVYNYRRVHRDVSICHVLTLLFRSSAHEPYFISRISMVKQYDEEGKDLEDKVIGYVEEAVVVKRNIIYELDIQDESNEELHYRLGLMHNDHIADENGTSLVGCSIGNCDLGDTTSENQQGTALQGNTLGILVSDGDDPSNVYNVDDWLSLFCNTRSSSVVDVKNRWRDF